MPEAEGTAPDPQTADPVKAAAHKATPTIPDTSGKIMLTAEELDAKVQAALTAERQKTEAKVRKDQEAADRKKAEEEGKFKELADASDKRAADAETRLKTIERERAVERALLKAAGEHKDYPYDVFEKYVAPTLLRQAEAEDFDVEKETKKAVADYVKDNPRQPKGRAGAPDTPPRQRPAGTANGQKAEPQFTGAASRF